ncbi:MAG: class IV adenylate cyclase [Halobacteriales archaeon]|nr:class IV adenylate cyclase [Halobacteriales archaeon]
MYEVELKLRTEHGPVRERLAELGAEEARHVRQEDTYYDVPHRDFAETDEAIRVRRETDGEGTTVKLTYKGPLVEAASKTREEHETVVADGDALRGILEGLGSIGEGRLRRPIEIGRHHHADRLVGPFVVEDAPEPVEPVLLGPEGGAGRQGGVLLQRSVHTLVAAVLVRAGGLDELGPDAERAFLVTARTIRQHPHWDPIREDPRFQGLFAGHAPKEGR